MAKNSRIGLILLMVAVFAYLVVLKSQLVTFSANALKVKTLSEESKSYEQRIVDIEAIKTQGDAIQTTLKSMYLAMPKTSQIPEALVMIDALASNSGVVLSTASIGTPSGSELPISLSFGGDLTSVTKFLDAIHANIRTAVVKNQSISSDEAGNLTISIQLGLVYQGGTN